MVVKPNSFSFSAAFGFTFAKYTKRALICPFFYIEIKVLQANLYFWHFQYGQKRIRQEAHPEFVVLVLLLFSAKAFASIVLIASEFCPGRKKIKNKMAKHIEGISL
jgi:hypothetical protein